MARARNLSGQRFGRLVAVRLAYISNRKAYWLCACDCGERKTVWMSHLVDGRIRSCGCLQREIVTARNRAGRTHGRTGTPEYAAWANMKDRCYRRDHPQWEYYGGAGIAVCDRWRGSFEDFLADMGQRPSPVHSIDRYPDPYGNYEPRNCRWATWKQQRANRRAHL